ncbi:hypothetical protein [Flavobacterium psychrolimnae]|uniref:Apea-like HEPN domain-containing protein n=1 Tax=Flavobacterium psychrolimnae TaxID=249351 RepID=A0A366B6P3_9FLAO|nr:hypothetical protein [Flavobacterium psychrolimnae]RBN51904.1 hypothetical protein DR980_01720 [Flavobacterium psychrolimnae]
MKESRLKYWKKDESLDSLLFFALRCRECVFDYTLDSFKYPALNSNTICKEALKLIKEIEEDNFTPKSITPVLEELIFKLKNDLVVKQLIGDDIKYYINFGDYTNLKEIKIKIEILFNKLSSDKNIKYLTEELKKLILENKEKRKIYELATNYISSLINVGFSQTFIYSSVNNIFFSSTSVDDISSLENFFNSFEIKPKKYNCIYKVSDIFDEISQSSNVFNIEILNQLDASFIVLDKNNFLNSKNKNERFLIVNEIIALDSVNAKSIAEKRLNKLSNLFVFFHHKIQPTWSNSSLIIDENKVSILIKDKVSAMSKATDYRPKKAAIKLNQLIRSLRLENSSFAKYDRVIDLHGIAVQNKVLENQLLQNWISFETLLVGYENTSKIDQVLKHLVPFLLIRYTNEQINELLKDINRFDQSFFRTQVKAIPEGENLLDKFTAILVLDKYKSVRIEFYKQLKYSPLNKFRMAEFHKIFSDINSLKAHIEKHKTKVDWQIKRMYRTRNLIVHAGIVPTFTETLVENSHNYLDKLISTINYLCINENSILSIEQALKEVEIIHSKRNANLKDYKDINENNYIKLLL